MEIIDGKEVSKKILAAIKENIEKENLKPFLAVVLIGQDEASKIYVNLKEKAAREIGIGFQKFEFPETVAEAEVLDRLDELNRDEKVNGIIVQLPLPSHLDKNKIINFIHPKKDVDGFHPENIQLFFEGNERFFPVLPKAILELLKATEVNLNNADAVVVANSDEFGKTMEFALEESGTFSDYILKEEIPNNLEDIKTKDIVITVCGVPGLIKGEMLKKGAIVIDGGITRVGDKVVGDVNFESVKNIASFVSSVPGGVGPVTIACLLKNVYLAAKKSR